MAFIFTQALSSVANATIPALGHAIGSVITNGSKADKDERAVFIGNAYTQMQPLLNGKNLMIVYPKHDAHGLANKDGSKVENKALAVPRKSGQTLTYQMYVFDYGTFKLQGDGGFVNWIFTAPTEGFKRDGKNLTWDKK